MARTSPALALAAVLLAATLAGGSAAVAGSKRGDTAAGAPGELARTERLAAPPGARAWRVLYHSRSRRGRDILVSGLVVAPDRAAPAGGFPVVAWAHGTTGWADRCAPSRGATASSLPLPELWRLGYVVAATDYEGLGTPGPHPYLVGASEGHGVLDSVRAAAQLPEAQAGGRVIVYGHSQGGHAALFAGELASTYAPELDIRGVVAAAPAAELDRLVRARRPTRYLAGVVATARAYAAEYDVPLGRVLTPWARSRLSLLDRGCLDAANARFDRPVGTVFRPGWFDRAPWPVLERANSPGRSPTRPPVLLLQGDRDDQIPVAVTRALHRRLCRIGDTVTLLEYAGADHGGVIGRSTPDVFAWVQERLAGVSAARDC